MQAAHPRTPENGRSNPTPAQGDQPLRLHRTPNTEGNGINEKVVAMGGLEPTGYDRKKKSKRCVEKARYPAGFFYIPVRISELASDAHATQGQTADEGEQHHHGNEAPAIQHGYDYVPCDFHIVDPECVPCV